MVVCVDSDVMGSRQKHTSYIDTIPEIFTLTWGWGLAGVRFLVARFEIEISGEC